MVLTVYPVDASHNMRYFYFNTDPEHKEKFEQCLSNITSSDGICLLTTFAHMTHSTKENVDQEFVKIVALEIYEVCTLFIN